MKVVSPHFYPVHRTRLAPFFLIAVLILLSANSISAQNDTAPSNSVKLFNQGQDAHEKNDFQTAVKFYDAALKANPEFSEAEYQRGAAYLALGDTDEAEKSFRRALELRENWTLPMVGLASVLMQKSDFPEAKNLLNKSIELDPQNSEAFVALANLHLRAKSSPETLKGFLPKLQNLTSQPNSSASAWAARAAIERSLENYDAAQTSLNNALAINPNDNFALSESANLFLAKNDSPRAQAAAENLVKATPGSTAAKLLLARVYAKDGKTAAALEILDTLDSANADVAALKNSLLINDSQDAATLEKTLANDPKNADVLSRLCALSRVSNPPKALDYCRRASELEPNNLDHYVAYGAALVQAKLFDNAISLFRKILQTAPGNYTAHANLATALFESKRYPEAKIEYGWLAKAKPDLAIAYYFLGITNDQTEDYAAALENYRKFLSLADNKQNQLEIEKVNLRLPSLEKLIKQKGKK